MSENFYYHKVKAGVDLYLDRAMNAEAKATRRLELLREIETLVNEEQFDMGHRNWDLHVVNNIRDILAKELADGD